MTPDEVTLAVIDALELGGLRYLIVGSLSSNFHGVPRATQDADFVVEVAAGDISRLAEALPATLVLESQAGFETVTGSLRYVIAAAGNPFICELFVHSDDPHDVERMRRRLRVSILGRQTFVATAEDAIVTKLRWATLARRGKDVEDVRNIIAVRGGRSRPERSRTPGYGRWCRAGGRAPGCGAAGRRGPRPRRRRRGGTHADRIADPDP